MKNILHPSWNPIKKHLFNENLNILRNTILPEISFQPSRDKIFKIFKNNLKDIKVVILGQDPYPTPTNAIGRAFAVSVETKIPKSLSIIRNEILNEGFNLESKKKWKTLQHWEEQGIFLLNTALTVETGKPGSHLKYWENFTQEIIKYISSSHPTIWVLWGKKAQQYKKYIVSPYKVVNYTLETIKKIPTSKYYNYILEAPHPAAEIYSGGKAGFYGCNHFIFINQILENKFQEIIKW